LKVLRRRILPQAVKSFPNTKPCGGEFFHEL
jgi:hypothetical protein